MGSSHEKIWILKLSRAPYLTTVALEDERERGGLDWKMLHAWIGEAPLQEGDSPADAFPSPTMIG